MEFISNIFNISPLFLLKIFVILLLSLYAIFSFVLYRQERLMAQTIEAPPSVVFSFLAFLHMILSITLLIFTIIAL